MALVDRYLKEQRDVTAVEAFSDFHDESARANSTLDHGEKYRKLIPLTKPAPNQQYAFEVDLDECTGCKACVAGCHSQNGLDEGETWRSVGMIHGGTTEDPYIQTITTACHHCAEPACMAGCPTMAYEKDPHTGIVKHLDDQCFGCQYCTIKCPYGVPQWDQQRGIVRKCDMCTDRLEENQAPACVQSCPNEAIKITLVDTEDVKTNADDYVDIPGSPDSHYTYPTTKYKSKKKLQENSKAVDHNVLKPEHPHMPLVVMLVLTQLSVGGFWAAMWGQSWFVSGLKEVSEPLHLIFSLSLGLLALLSSVFHLGRPLYAFRAFIGLRTSWLSREIISFAVFAKLAVLYVALRWFDISLWNGSHEMIGAMVCASGLLGVLCSIMIYKDTPRNVWSGMSTPIKFLGTQAVMGASLILMTAMMALFKDAEVMQTLEIQEQLRMVVLLVVACVVCKLIVDALPLFSLASQSGSYVHRTALLMVRDLWTQTQLRFFCGLIGGVFLPLWIYVLIPQGQGGAAMGISIVSFCLLLLGELMERYLFFTAVVAPKMPGGAV